MIGPLSLTEFEVQFGCLSDQRPSLVRSLCDDEFGRRPAGRSQSPASKHGILLRSILPTTPAFRHFRIEPLPYSTAHICGMVRTKGMVQWRSLFTNT